jgi:hypothetical protein
MCSSSRLEVAMATGRCALDSHIALRRHALECMSECIGGKQRCINVFIHIRNMQKELFSQGPPTLSLSAQTEAERCLISSYLCSPPKNGEQWSTLLYILMYYTHSFRVRVNAGTMYRLPIYRRACC